MRRGLRLGCSRRAAPRRPSRQRRGPPRCAVVVEPIAATPELVECPPPQADNPHASPHQETPKFPGESDQIDGYRARLTSFAREIPLHNCQHILPLHNNFQPTVPWRASHHLWVRYCRAPSKCPSGPARVGASAAPSVGQPPPRKCPQATPGYSSEATAWHGNPHNGANACYAGLHLRPWTTAT
jgi:hypothetical protein